MLTNKNVDYFKDQEFAAEQDQPDKKHPQKLVCFEDIGYFVFECLDDLNQDFQQDGGKNLECESVNDKHGAVRHKQVQNDPIDEDILRS